MAPYPLKRPCRFPAESLRFPWKLAGGDPFPVRSGVLGSCSVTTRPSLATISASTHIQDGFIASDLPPPAPDGGPVLPPPRLPVVGGVSLCMQGPCRHLHVFSQNAEAEQPLDGSGLVRPRLDANGEPIVKRWDEDGSPVYETEPWTPREVIRQCYPALGVVLELSNDAPIRDCNRWDPEDPAEPNDRDVRRARYLQRKGTP